METPAPENRLPEYRNKPSVNWVTWTICFVLAVILWFIVSLGKNYQVKLRYPVRFTDAPPEISLILKKHEYLDLQVKANGFNHLLNYLYDPLDTLELSLSENRANTYYITNRNLKSISQALPYTLEATEAKPDTLFFAFDAKGKKRVPVINQVKVNYDGSWLPLGDAVLRPDSVTLLGNPDDLKKIKSWRTSKHTFEKISRNIEEWVSLDTAEHIIVQPASVLFSQKAAEFTQGSKTLKVQVYNVPGRKKIRLNPDTVHISWLVPMSRFEESNEALFEVGVDFSRLRADQQYVIPKLKTAPDYVRNITIHPERIRFVITSLKK